MKEQSAHETKPMLRSFLKVASNVLWVGLDTRFHILSCNKAFRRHLHVNDTPVGEPLNRFLHSENGNGEDIVVTPSGHDPFRNILRSYASDTVYFCFFFSSEDGIIMVGETAAETAHGVVETMTHLNNELANMSRELSKKNAELKKALSEVKTLRGLIPICASCKSIRDDQGIWKQLEQYIEDHSDADFSHGICPECTQKLYPEYAGKLKK